MVTVVMVGVVPVVVPGLGRGFRGASPDQESCGHHRERRTRASGFPRLQNR